MAGNWSTAAGASIVFTGGSFTNLSLATFSGAGSADFQTGSLFLGSTVQPPGLQLSGGSLNLLPSFQGGVVTNLTLSGMALRGTNRVTGFLVSSNATLSGKLTIDTGGRLDLTGSDSKTFDKLDLFNAGTVRWLAGSIGFSFGSAANVITNAGLWEISADSSFAYGFGGAIPRFVNTGTLRKIAATGTTAFQNLQFENAGLVDVQKGRIQFSNGTGLMAGNWSTAAGASIVFTGGSFTNLSLATFSGAGSADFQTGSLFLGSTVQPPGLQLSGGSLNLLPSFQGGVVTNLTLSGMALRGTNRVTGFLVSSNATLSGKLTIDTGGRLDLTGSDSKTFDKLDLFNAGTVRWLAGSIGFSFGSAANVITNAGLWEISADSSFAYGFGGAIPRFVNTGTLRKIAAAGTTAFQNLQFVNPGVVESSRGTLQLPAGFSQSEGVLRLTGGTVGVNAGFIAVGGLVEGSGGVLGASFTGGILSPGGAGTGQILFPDGLRLSTGASLRVNGSGLTPGSQHDQLKVTGTVTLNNATLNITALGVEWRSTIRLILIVARWCDPVVGTFLGLAEGALAWMSVSICTRIRYKAGTGNDASGAG